jgi:hypothetical protein
MRAKEFLIERILNLHTPEEKAKYADQVWDLLQKAYQKAGGFKSATSKEELIDNPGYWKVVKRGDKITAVSLYKKVPQTKTFKVYASGAEADFDPDKKEYSATQQGKHDYIDIKKADISQKRSWAEVSGGPEILAKRLGARPISNKFAAYLTGKEIKELNPDGYHYTRLTMGEPHEKAIYGFIGLTPDQEKALENNGLAVKDLPR